MQFSIRAMLALTLLAGGLCGLMFGVPNDYLPYTLMVPWAVLPGALISTLVYGRGYARAFAIGSLPIAIPCGICAIAVIAMASDMNMNEDEANTLRIVFAVGLAIILLSGASSAAIRWVFSPQRATRARKSKEIATIDETVADTILTGRIAAAGETGEPTGRRPASAVEQALSDGQPQFAPEPQFTPETLRREPVARPIDLSEGPS